jgi:putative resolvase
LFSCPYLGSEWDRDGKLVAFRSPTGRRYYTDEQIRHYRSETKQPINQLAVIYTRVSSQAQKPDLKNQKARLEEFCSARGLATDERIEEIGDGLNLSGLYSPPLAAMLKIFSLLIPRCLRRGSSFLAHLCRHHKCELLVMNTESLSPEREMVEDLMAITQCFSARLDGLRNYKAALKKALKKEPGFKGEIPRLPKTLKEDRRIRNSQRQVLREWP